MRRFAFRGLKVSPPCLSSLVHCRDARPAKLPRCFTLADPHYSQEDRMGYAGMVEEVGSRISGYWNHPMMWTTWRKAPTSACELKSSVCSVSDHGVCAT